ncbi:DoxX family protein [Clostridiales bacterium oral taxon 876 str. F0540]|nr:DoxX family protein [Clostridiales bacterium oral taxon 876 str. F0540]
MSETKKIVILGTGYAGVTAAKQLHKKFKKDTNIEITLIGKDPYHTLMTELHEVAGGRVEHDSVQVSLKRIFSGKRVNVVLDEIKSIDFNKRILSSEESTYEYDYLILGSGSEPAFFGVPGVEENGFTIWSFEDAIRIREHVEGMFRKASKITNADKRKQMLTFVVAGAGFTGVETIGELLEWKKKLCRNYDINESEVKLVLVEALDKILPILNDGLIAKSERYLLKHGVEIIKSSPITNVDKNFINLKNGSEIKTNTLIWTCGVQASKFARNLGLKTSRAGRIQTNEYMQSVDYANVYVVGDNSYLEEDGKGLPQIVETAIQTAETAVNNIAADMESKEKKAHKSNYHGLMVSIGSRYAVASLMGMSLSGFIAMAMKHLVNLHYLFGVAGFNACWAYIVHEFFDVKEKRSIIGGHASAKSHSFWLAILRVYVGIMWLIEGINKVNEGWLREIKIPMFMADATSSASVADGAASAVQQAPAILSAPPQFFSSFMNLLKPFGLQFQILVVVAEIGIGLALVAGLFTFLASAASVFFCLNFILSAMFGWDKVWFIFAGIALMGGAGRSLGLDYYVMPWLKRWWNNTPLARKTYLYMEHHLTED